MKMRNAMLVSCGFFFFAAGVSAQGLVVHNVTVVSPERAQPLTGADVVLDGDRIVRVSAHAARLHHRNSQVIDGNGLYLVPGLIDSHVHLGQIPGMTDEQEEAHPVIARMARAQIPKSYLYFGFTTLVDLNSTPQAMVTWNAHPIHPDTYFCGAAPIMDGYPMSFVPKPYRYQMKYFVVEPGNDANLPAGVDPVLHTPADVVARMKADGASCVKTHFERGFGGARRLPVPRVETIRELVKAAHAANMPVFLHANSSEAQAFGLDADVDIFAHGIWKWTDAGSGIELTPSVIKILDGVIQAKKGWQPTIQVLYGERDLFNDAFLSDPRLATAVPASLIEWYRTDEGQWFRKELAKIYGVNSAAPTDVDGPAIARVSKAVAYLAKRDARILFGSDTPSDETYANPPGLNGRLEMQRLIDAGMTPAQVFRAATITNAQALGMAKEIGTIEVGKRANLLLLHADPNQSIQAFDRIEKIFLRGKPLDRAELAANAKVSN